MPAQCPNMLTCPSERGLWTPVDSLRSTGLLLHADTNVSSISGDKITKWKSVANNWEFTQATDAARPTLVETWGGRRKSVLSTISTRLVGTTLFTPFESATQFTIFAVFNATGTGWIFEKGSATPWERVGVVVIGTDLYMVVNASAIMTPISLNAPHIACITYNAGAIVMRLNGAQVNTGTLDSATGGNAANRLNLGFGVDPNTMPGRVRDICILPYAADLGLIQKIEGYLHWRGDLTTSLVAIHPHCFSPPRDNRYLKRRTRTIVSLAGAAGSSGGGPVTHEATISETSTVSDAETALAQFVASLSDSASMADAISATAVWAATLSELSSLLDSLTTVSVFSGDISESVTATDAQSAIATWATALTESATTAEATAAIATWASAISEAASAADVVSSSATWSAILSEVSSLLDAVTTGSVFSGSISEGVTAADALSSLATFATAMVEATTQADTQSASAVFGAGLSEAATAADGFGNTANFLAALAESATLADLIASGNVFAAAVNEATTTSDAMLAAMTYVRAITETTGLSDAQTAQAVFASALAEDATVEQIAQAAAIFGVLVNEAVIAIVSQNGQISGNEKLANILNLFSVVKTTALFNAIKEISMKENKCP